MVSLVFFGGAYFYKQSLQKNVNEMAASLERAQNAFEPGLINELSRLSGSIIAAKQVLENHRVISKILNLIGALTLKDTTFSNFKYAARDNKITIAMNGETKSYAGVALQAKLFEESGSVESVIFSNLSLKEAGKVNFNVELAIKPEFLIYEPQSL